MHEVQRKPNASLSFGSFSLEEQKKVASFLPDEAEEHIDKNKEKEVISTHLKLTNIQKGNKSESQTTRRQNEIPKMKKMEEIEKEELSESMNKRKIWEMRKGVESGKKEKSKEPETNQEEEGDLNKKMMATLRLLEIAQERTGRDAFDREISRPVGIVPLKEKRKGPYDENEAEFLQALEISPKSQKQYFWTEIRANQRGRNEGEPIEKHSEFLRKNQGVKTRKCFKGEEKEYFSLSKSKIKEKERKLIENPKRKPKKPRNNSKSKSTAELRPDPKVAGDETKEEENDAVKEDQRNLALKEEESASVQNKRKQELQELLEKMKEIEEKSKNDYIDDTLAINDEQVFANISGRKGNIVAPLELSKLHRFSSKESNSGSPKGETSKNSGDSSKGEREERRPTEPSRKEEKSKGRKNKKRSKSQKGKNQEKRGRKKQKEPQNSISEAVNLSSSEKEEVGAWKKRKNGENSKKAKKAKKEELSKASDEEELKEENERIGSDEREEETLCSKKSEQVEVLWEKNRERSIPAKPKKTGTDQISSEDEEIAKEISKRKKEIKEKPVSRKRSKPKRKKEKPKTKESQNKKQKEGVEIQRVPSFESVESLVRKNEMESNGITSKEVLVKGVWDRVKKKKKISKEEEEDSLSRNKGDKGKVKKTQKEAKTTKKKKENGQTQKGDNGSEQNEKKKNSKEENKEKEHRNIPQKEIKKQETFGAKTPPQKSRKSSIASASNSKKPEKNATMIHLGEGMAIRSPETIESLEKESFDESIGNSELIPERERHPLEQIATSLSRFEDVSETSRSASVSSGKPVVSAEQVSLSPKEMEATPGKSKRSQNSRGKERTSGSSKQPKSQKNERKEKLKNETNWTNEKMADGSQLPKAKTKTKKKKETPEEFRDQEKPQKEKKSKEISQGKLQRGEETPKGEHHVLNTPMKENPKDHHQLSPSGPIVINVMTFGPEDSQIGQQKVQEMTENAQKKERIEKKEKEKKKAVKSPDVTRESKEKQKGTMPNHKGTPEPTQLKNTKIKAKIGPGYFSSPKPPSKKPNDIYNGGSKPNGTDKDPRKQAKVEEAKRQSKSNEKPKKRSNDRLFDFLEKYPSLSRLIKNSGVVFPSKAPEKLAKSNNLYLLARFPHSDFLK